MKRILLLLGILLSSSFAVSQKRIICYFSNSAVYRPGNGNIAISDINATLCTHLIYAFAGISDDGQVRPSDAYADLPGNKDGYNKFNQLRSRNPNLKTLLAVGGWNEGPARFSRIANDPLIRKTFVNNALVFVKRYGFNGLDLDWEYPNSGGVLERDRKNYVLLLKELKEVFEKEGLLLTAAVAGSVGVAKLSYIVPEVAKHLDFLNLMTYDFHGIWDRKTGINSPLYPHSLEWGDEKLLNVNASINFWLSENAPREKINVGIPFYARTFTLDNPQNNGIGAPASLPGLAGPYTKTAGNLGYNEICEKYISERWDYYFHKEQKVPYAVKGDQWIGYDDVSSLKIKADYVNNLNLGGVAVWSIETDDFKGICGEKFPLLKTLNLGLK